jgi:hypothetical protein
MTAISIILLISVGLNIYFAFLLFLKNEEEEEDEFEPDHWLREEDEAAWEKIEMDRVARGNRNSSSI